MPASAVLSESRSQLQSDSAKFHTPNSDLYQSVKPGCHLRAHFSYAPSLDPLVPGAGLLLQHGDIVQVTECSGHRYWRGFLLQEPTRECYIPSPQLVGDHYEVVVERHLPYVQPIILTGSLKNQVQDHFYQERPEKFASCVPHTTRAPRESEMPAYDYHFVRRDTMQAMINSELFIEVGEFNKNLYGTTEAAVRLIAQRERKHCILDSCSAIPKLHAAKIYPLVFLTGAKSWRQLVEMRHGEIQEFEARELFDKDTELEKEYSKYYHAIVRESTLEGVFSKVLETIEKYSQDPVWIPACEW
uniref:Guanylate kinase-like domain-containing protein n=1 Tax=Plectus sambesii TaxID=2011161 RepID=A0A914UT35_9BILA